MSDQQLFSISRVGRLTRVESSNGSGHRRTLEILDGMVCIYDDTVAGVPYTQSSDRNVALVFLRECHSAMGQLIDETTERLPK